MALAAWPTGFTQSDRRAYNDAHNSPAIFLMRERPTSRHCLGARAAGPTRSGDCPRSRTKPRPFGVFPRVSSSSIHLQKITIYPE